MSKINRTPIFFNVLPDRNRFTNPLMEVGQDVALISFCLCGLNAVDIFNAKKNQYVDGIFSYERQKTRKTRADKSYKDLNDYLRGKQLLK